MLRNILAYIMFKNPTMGVTHTHTKYYDHIPIKQPKINVYNECTNTQPLFSVLCNRAVCLHCAAHSLKARPVDEVHRYSPQHVLDRELAVGCAANRRGGEGGVRLIVSLTAGESVLYHGFCCV